ncbi:unnamed protein product [Psylliodes chrysocephalus]|uniref:Uncharacterized protein n=1 Tax=Psylliodes chrysocephalus TaxID=3402493 RepID=A0A9P0G648_9CUCU|nr:unnamed protein product [Psylliodes chrysocephala]
MGYTSRRKWLSKHSKLIPVKHKSMSAQHSRSESRYFTLPLPDFTEIAVRRLTFLNTLGYTNDSVITELVAKMKKVPCGDRVKEQRGGSYGPEVNRAIIRNHIESLNPCVNH